MLLVLFIFRIGTHLPVPGLDLSKVGEMGNSSLYQMIAGGNYGTVFAMGIGPYINASIIMQLLTVAIPKLEQINKEGEEGRRKINQYTRVAAVILSLLQGCGQVYTVHTAFVHQNFFVYIMALVTMVTGTIFVMWMGEKLTEVGIGNGASFLIFANILSGLASGVAALYTVGATNGAAGWVKVAAIIAILLVVMVFVIFIQDGERRIPVQYSKKMVGRRYIGGQSSYIPIKVNIAGVMSIIFAISLLQFPYTINQLFHIPALETVARYLSTSHPVGAVLYVILIFCFTFFYNIGNIDSLFHVYSSPFFFLTGLHHSHIIRTRYYNCSSKHLHVPLTY